LQAFLIILHWFCQRRPVVMTADVFMVVICFQLFSYVFNCFHMFSCVLNVSNIVFFHVFSLFFNLCCGFLGVGAKCSKT
jgi:hypothetical protein